MNIYDEALELLNNGCDGPQAFDTYKIALERAKMVEELLELYRLKNYNMEDYYTYNSLRGSQKAYDNLKDINEEINLKEKELELIK